MNKLEYILILEQEIEELNKVIKNLKQEIVELKNVIEILKEDEKNND